MIKDGRITRLFVAASFVVEDAFVGEEIADEGS